MNTMTRWVCLLWAVGMAMALPAKAEVKPEGGKVATDILGILSLPAAESEAAVLAFCRGAGEAQREALCSLAEQADYVAPVYGEVAVALTRVADESLIPWGLKMTGNKHPVLRYLGVVGVRASGGAASREALLGLLAAPDPGVRSQAALSLRRWHDQAVKDALAKMAAGGEYACERSCAGSALEWIAASPDPMSLSPRKVLNLNGRSRPAAGNVRDAGVIRITSESSDLADPAICAQVAERVRAGATLHVVSTTGKFQAGLADVLRSLDLSLPPLETVANRISSAWNWDEGHAAQDLAHDGYRGRVYADPNSEIMSRVAANIMPWMPQGVTVFKSWDPKVWAAPLRSVERSDVAFLLDAPPAKGRGRVVLDLTGGDLKAWEHNNNLTAFIEGPQALRMFSIRGSFKTALESPYFNVDESVETPHVKWGKPLAGGPVKAAFLVPEMNIRNAIELVQRVELDRTYLPFNPKSFGDKDDKNKRDRPVIDGASALRLRMFLADARGVLVIPGFEMSGGQGDFRYSWNALFPDLRAELMQAVRNGLGLVVQGTEFPMPGEAGFEGIPEPVPAEILRALPLPEAKAREMIACYRHGKGRILQFRLGMSIGRAFLSLGPEFKVSGLLVEYPRIFSDEYAHAAAAAGILWASGRAQDIKGARAESSIRDRFNRLLPADAPLTGPAVEETRFLDAAGKVVGWSARRTGPERAPVLTVTFPGKLIQPGAPLKATIAWGDLQGETLLCEVIDRHGRVARTSTIRVPGPAATVTLDGWAPLCRLHDFHVVLQKGGKPVAETMAPFAVDTRPDPLNYQLWLWGGSLCLAPGLHQMGVTGFPPEMGVPGYSGAGDFPREAITEIALRDGFEIQLIHAFGNSLSIGTVDIAQGGVCKPGMSDPSVWAAAREHIAAKGPIWRLLGARRGELCDEWTLGPGFCYGPITMTHFRRELQAKYKTLTKLNAAWGRNFQKWTEVVPDRLGEAAKRGNLVSWSEHRAFMDDEVAKLAGQAQRYWREYVPDAVIGFSSYITPSADNGFDMEKLLAQSGFIVRRGWELRDLRDLSHPEAIFSNWMNAGYDTTLRSWHLALLETSYDLLEHAGSIYYWYGYENFDYPMIRPDLTVVEMLRPMADELVFLRRGIDRVVLGAEMDSRGFGVLYSQSSLRTLGGLKALAGGPCQVAWGWDEAQAALQSLQVKGRLYSTADLVVGRLQKEGVKLLWLPGVVSLTDAQMSALIRFVEEGGCLVADVLPGRYSEDSAPQDQGRMAKLFGVAGQFEPRKDVAPAPVKASGAFAPLEFALGKAKPCVAGIKTAGGTAFGTVGGEIALVENKTGKGKTLLLNFSLPEAVAAHPRSAGTPGEQGGATPEVATPQVKAAAVTTADDVSLLAAKVMAEWGGVKPAVQVYADAGRKSLYPGMDVYTYRDGEAVVVGILNRGLAERRAVVVFPVRSALYELRNPDSRDGGTLRDQCEVVIPPGASAVCVGVPQPLPPLSVKSERAKDGDLRLILAGGGGRRVVRIEVTDPAGRARDELSGNVDFRGEGSFRIPLAANDPQGIWRARISDVITRESREVEAKP